MRKKWKYLIPVVAFTIAITVAAAQKEDANADYIAGDIFSADTSNTNMVFQLVEDGPDGDYYYQTKGKHHTSDTVHQTVAIEFSALNDEFIGNNGFTPKKWKYPTSQSGDINVDPHEYYVAADGSIRRISVIMGRYDDLGVRSKSIVLSDGQELNTWIIDHDALWARIQQTQPDWYNSLTTRINSGQEYYMGIDPVITIITNYDDSLSDDLDECQAKNYYLNAKGKLHEDENGYPSYY